ncbi:MAG: chemotaxis protein CheX [Desulfobulbaceae bacterium]|nr:chemotaxis protein CheX [Desulfobulbaceae bacterium]
MDLHANIINNTKEVFSSMLGMEVTPQEAIEAGMTHTNSISGIIGLAGSVKGMLAVHAPEKVALSITGGFLGMEVEEINEDVQDAIGELANMLAGGVKLTLTDNSSEIKLSVPSVIYGDTYNVSAPSKAITFIIPFSIDSGLFYVEFHLVKQDT